MSGMGEPNGGAPGEPTRAEMQDRIDGLERRHSADRDQIDRLGVQHVADRELIRELQAELALELDKVENLGLAMATARRIGNAMGILMERHKIADEQAFGLLRAASQHSGRKLRDIAEHVVSTGELPPPHRSPGPGSASETRDLEGPAPRQ